MERSKDQKRPWTPPVIKSAGTVADVIRGGGGKLTIVANDIGDVNKPKGQEGA
jgi:hypothetical protein